MPWQQHSLHDVIVSQLFLRVQRTAALQWVAAVSLDLGEEHLGMHLPALLQPVYREVSDVNKTAGEGLYTLAQEVLDLVKGVAGREMFSKVFAQVHQSVLATREKRRKQAALEVNHCIYQVSLGLKKSTRYWA